MTNAIRVIGLNKSFIIPEQRQNTVKEALFNLHQKKNVRTLHALKDIKFDVQRGEFFGIIGRNGSGKSTLLKILAKIYKPDRGSQLEIRGSVSPFLELGVGFNPELTAYENIFLNATLLGLSHTQIKRKFEQIIEFAELEQFVYQKVKFFSSGMQLRLAFSVAIQADSDILILDEVLAVGDVNFQQKCFEIFRNFKKEGKTIIFVSHDLGAVRQFCHRAMYMKDGQIVMIGDPNEVVDHYLYEDHPIAVFSPTRKVGIEKPVSIENVACIDKFGHSNKTFVCGDPMTIRVSYRSHITNISEPVLGIAIYHENGTHIYGTNSQLQQKELRLDQNGYFDIKTRKLPLLQGNYLLTVAFHHRDHTVYDWQDKAYAFCVQKNNADDGLVDMLFQFGD